MLAVDPVARPQSARELLAPLHRCRETVTAAPKRRRQRQLIALALGLLSMGGFGLTILLSHRSPPAAAIAAEDKSIAVLPFESRSEDSKDAFFADGIQDEVRTSLVKVRDMKVIGRS